ncbi:MAG: secretion protein XcpP [Pseudomonadaceae bacterium]|nr:secretion protein XcpP [Pseudomonadaceae bacterium]
MSASLAWQSADWLRLLRAPTTAADSTLEIRQTAITEPLIGPLFGEHSKSNAPAPSTNLRLTLLGSFVHADPQRSSAIIRSEGQSAQRYTLNSEITEGVRLHAVAADRVELMRNGRRESLSFPLERSANSGLQSNTPDAMADPLEQLSDMQTDDLNQLRERMNALREQMQATDDATNGLAPTEQPPESN